MEVRNLWCGFFGYLADDDVHSLNHYFEPPADVAVVGRRGAIQGAAEDVRLLRDGRAQRFHAEPPRRAPGLYELTTAAVR